MVKRPWFWNKSISKYAISLQQCCLVSPNCFLKSFHCHNILGPATSKPSNPSLNQTKCRILLKARENMSNQPYTWTTAPRNAKKRNVAKVWCLFCECLLSYWLGHCHNAIVTSNVNKTHKQTLQESLPISRHNQETLHLTVTKTVG